MLPVSDQNVRQAPHIYEKRMTFDEKMPFFFIAFERRAMCPLLLSRIPLFNFDKFLPVISTGSILFLMRAFQSAEIKGEF